MGYCSTEDLFHGSEHDLPDYIDHCRHVRQFAGHPGGVGYADVIEQVGADQAIAIRRALSACVEAAKALDQARMS